jgi:hypothetical protein
MARGIGSCLIDQMDCKIVPTWSFMIKQFIAAWSVEAQVHV